MHTIRQQSTTLMLWLMLALLMASCAQLGLTPPQSTQDRIMYGYSQTTGVYQGIAQAVTAGSISKAQGMDAIKTVDGARAALDAANMANKAGDATGALKYLQTAMTVLQAIQAQLPKPGGAK